MHHASNIKGKMWIRKKGKRVPPKKKARHCFYFIFNILKLKEKKIIYLLATLLSSELLPTYTYQTNKLTNAPLATCHTSLQTYIHIAFTFSVEYVCKASHYIYCTYVWAMGKGTNPCSSRNVGWSPPKGSGPALDTLSHKEEQSVGVEL